MRSTLAEPLALSLIVSSRNGGAKLDRLFSSLRKDAFLAGGAELVLAASACTDDTEARPPLWSRGFALAPVAKW